MTVTLAAQPIMSLVSLGDFGAAIAALGDDWAGPGIMPSAKGRSDECYAEVLMICGILTSEVGAMRGLPVQNAAKNMLTRSSTLFRDNPMAQRAMMLTGNVFLRTGEYHEAIAYSDTILAQEPDLETTLGATRIKSIAQCDLGEPKLALMTLKAVWSLRETAIPLIRGKFSLQLGLILRKLNRQDEAVSAYEEAADLFQEAGSARYEAAASNNLAGVYTDEGRYLAGHVAAERAVSLFQRISDKSHEAKAWDQIAKVYIAEKDFHGAERAARKAVELLTNADRNSWLAEALITHGNALVLLGNSQAQCQLLKAMEISTAVGNRSQQHEAVALLWQSVRSAKEAAKTIVGSVLSIERVVIERTLAKHDGRVTPSANELGIRHSHLEQRIVALGLSLNRAPKRRKSIFKK